MSKNIPSWVCPQQYGYDCLLSLRAYARFYIAERIWSSSLSSWHTSRREVPHATTVISLYLAGETLPPWGCERLEKVRDEAISRRSYRSVDTRRCQTNASERVKSDYMYAVTTAFADCIPTKGYRPLHRRGLIGRSAILWRLECSPLCSWVTLACMTVELFCARKSGSFREQLQRPTDLRTETSPH